MEQYWRSWLQKHSLDNKNISTIINNDMHNRKKSKDKKVKDKCKPEANNYNTNNKTLQ